MIRKLLLASVVTLCAVTACGDDDDDDGTGGSGGKAGSAGRGGSAGKGGTAGSAGSGGGISGSGGALGGQGGTAGSAGMGGTGGSAGADGGAGKAGSGGSAGADGGAGKGGTAGADGGVTDGGGDASDGGLVDAALRVHLRFDDATGTSASDSSGNDFHGTLHNATWTTGRVGGAVDLANNDEREPENGGAPDPAWHVGKQYVSLPPNILAPCADATIAVWVRLRSLVGFTRVLDLDGGLNGFLYWTVTAGGPANPGLLFNIFRNPPIADQRVTGTYPAADAGGTLLNEWHHYAVTLSGDVARAYFDGRQVGENVNMTYNPSDIGVRAADAGAGPQPHAWLGRSLFPKGDPYLNAQLDELRISCRAYTAGEIAQLAD